MPASGRREAGVRLPHSRGGRGYPKRKETDGFPPGTPLPSARPTRSLAQRHCHLTHKAEHLPRRYGRGNREQHDWPPQPRETLCIAMREELPGTVIEREIHRALVRQEPHLRRDERDERDQ